MLWRRIYKLSHSSISKLSWKISKMNGVQQDTSSFISPHICYLSLALIYIPIPISICQQKNPRFPFVMGVTTSEVTPNLDDVTIFTSSGEPVLPNDLLDQNEGLAVVALLRHFGCICCWELASELKEAKERFDSAGVKLVAVGVGTPDKARILAERLPFPMDCLYADPNRKAYDVLGLYYGFGRTFFSTKMFAKFKSLKKVAKTYTIKATPKDKSGVLQQGGMFIFKGKKLLYAWKDKGSGDHAPLGDIFEICSRVTTA